MENHAVSGAHKARFHRPHRRFHRWNPDFRPEAPRCPLGSPERYPIFYVWIPRRFENQTHTSSSHFGKNNKAADGQSILPTTWTKNTIAQSLQRLNTRTLAGPKKWLLGFVSRLALLFNRGCFVLYDISDPQGSAFPSLRAQLPTKQRNVK